MIFLDYITWHSTILNEWMRTRKKKNEVESCRVNIENSKDR